MQINKKLVKYNFVKGRGNQKIKYIVIHDTGNSGKGANANNHFTYFNGANRQASAHYFVDETQVLQIIEDSDTAWSVGDGKGKNGITNQNSLGVEICVNSDGNYNVAVQKTLELVKFLMEKHNIPMKDVVRHFDASGKTCPRSMIDNNWKKWFEFKDNLAKMFMVSKKIDVSFYGKLHKVDGELVNGTNMVDFNGVKVPIRQVADTLGFKVGWDDNLKRVLMD